MCAKVKAEVQNIAHELVVSGLDSATSLIQVKIADFLIDTNSTRQMSSYRVYKVVKLFQYLFIQYN